MDPFQHASAHTTTQCALVVAGIVAMLLVFWYVLDTQASGFASNSAYAAPPAKSHSDMMPHARNDAGAAKPDAKPHAAQRSPFAATPISVEEHVSYAARASDAYPVPDWDPARMSLEQGVFDSHHEFTDDAYITAQGATANNVERDDPNDIVPWVGLRRPDYSSVVPDDNGHGSTSSAYPAQMPQGRGSYVL